MSDSWSQLNDARRRVRERWPHIRSLPRIPRAMAYAAARIGSGARILDIGASDGRFGRKLASGCRYETLDTDSRMEATFRSFEGVPGAAYDAVVCFEMIEHVSLDEAERTLRSITEALRPGGLLFLTTPNVHHPWTYLRSATHVTPFCYDELGGLIEICGLRVEEMLRCHHDAVLKGIARWLAAPLYRIVGVDYAKSICAVARRPETSTRSEN